MKKALFFVVLMALLVGCVPTTPMASHPGVDLTNPEMINYVEGPGPLPGRGHYIAIELLDNYAEKVLIRVFFQGIERCNLEVSNPANWEQKTPLYFNGTNCPGLRIEYTIDFYEMTATQSSDVTIPLPVFIGNIGSNQYYKWGK